MKPISVIRKSKLWLAISGVLLLITFVSLMTQGMNLSIDFLGGTRLAVAFAEEKTTGQVRDVLSGAGFPDSVIQQVADQKNEFYITVPPLSDEQRLELQEKVEQNLGTFELRSVDAVSPVIGSELRNAALLAVLLATLGMMLYIVVRFEWRFAIAAIIALTHDVVLTAGLFSVFGLPVDTSFVAAILTIYGYSINDTIIIFDRIRENLNIRRRESLVEIVDRSINQVLARSINTSLTTLLAIGAVYVFGGPTVSVLALALIVGIAFGTYSSIFIASPLYIWIAEGKIGGKTAPQAKASTR